MIFLRAARRCAAFDGGGAYFGKSWSRRKIRVMETGVNATLPPPAKPASPSAPRGRAKPRCAHCGAAVTEGETYCCGGCAFVSGLIRDEGLDAYYNLKDPVIASAQAALEPSRDFGWLADAARAAEARAGDG
ncbi:MAG: heavy metal translocating P-type ATPase metal-binding domain-containing protein, partial [Burkholderiales bacterium]|nr:heavy metal translocating P-type ATPase metal-binding domain-containing protein [Opitutaceae bacterium]